MISLSIKVPTVEFIAGAALQATFKGNSILIGNQKIGSNNCDILFRSEYGIQAEVGWNENKNFYIGNVDFDDALVEILTAEGSIYVDLEKGAGKVFDKIKDEIVLLVINNDVEIVCSLSDRILKDEKTSPLGGEIVSITEQAKEKLFELKDYQGDCVNYQSDSETKPVKKKRKSRAKSKIVEPIDDSSDSRELKVSPVNEQIKVDEENELEKINGKLESNFENRTMEDVAWWARSDEGWEGDMIPSNDDVDGELLSDGDIDDFEEMPSRKDSFRAFAVEFDSDDDDESSISTELRKSEFEIEYKRNWQQYKVSKVVFRLQKRLLEGQRISIIPRFPGCLVVPEKFLFDNETVQEVEFFVTPIRLGSCNDFEFEFTSGGKEIGRKKFDNKVKVKTTYFTRFVLIALVLNFIFTCLILVNVSEFIKNPSVVEYSLLGLFTLAVLTVINLGSKNKLIKEIGKMKKRGSEKIEG